VRRHGRRDVLHPVGREKDRSYDESHKGEPHKVRGLAYIRLQPQQSLYRQEPSLSRYRSPSDMSTK
jgi:hypothetical protein